MKTILLAGGGSGGHLTPLIAVAEALKEKNSRVRVVHVGQKQENLQDVFEGTKIDEHFSITAGKFRRYHGESFLSHLLDFKTLFLNIRDFFRFILGTFQAWILLGRLKPDYIFLKGGFVCVPIGWAARMRRIPYITHDSDAVPGLANRLTAKHAVYNLTAMPTDLYPYNFAKTIQVGIPLRAEFKKVSKTDRDNAKTSLDIKPTQPVLFSVGGGLGAQRLNMALVNASKQLLQDISGLVIIHLTGKKLFSETEDAYKAALNKEQLKRVRLIDFTSEVARLSSAADVVLTRAGATNIAEFALQAKACIVVPNPVLTGGQQLHNAKLLSDTNSAVVVEESNLDNLPKYIVDLLESSETEREDLAKRLNSLAVPDASEKIAEILLKDLEN